MPGRNVHMPVGVVAGAIVALVSGEGRTAEERLVEAIAGGIGGAIGGCAPDVLEPATSYNHRQFFHSQTAGLFALVGLVAIILDPISRHVDVSQPAQVDWERLIGKAQVKGTLTGGISHLALDSRTTMGLPNF